MAAWKRFLLLFCALAVGGIGLLGTARAQTPPADGASDARALRLGLMPYLSTRTLLSTYKDIGETLEQHLQQPVQLLTAPDFDSFIARVIEGQYDLVLLAPHYARLAMVDHGYTALLRHAAPIRGVLVTHRDQPLPDLAALRGHNIAVVDRSALLVIVGALSLTDHGLTEGKDYQFVETVSHSSALHNALSGKSRAALISYSTLRLAPAELQRDAVMWGDLAVIPGQFYITHPRVTAATRQRIKQALQAFAQSPAGQQFFDKTSHGGLIEPSTADLKQMDRLLPETRRQLRAAKQ